MSDSAEEYRWSEVLTSGFLDMRHDEEVLVIGRITQLTETDDDLSTGFRSLEGTSVLPNGRIVFRPTLYNLYVYRQDGQARMLLTRVDPFHYEHVGLSELEMNVIMSWACRMSRDGIGRFTPADGGWFWWVK